MNFYLNLDILSNMGLGIGLGNHFPKITIIQSSNMTQKTDNNIKNVPNNQSLSQRPINPPPTTNIISLYAAIASEDNYAEENVSRKRKKKRTEIGKNSHA